MRELEAPTREAMLAERTSEALLTLLTLALPDGDFLVSEDLGGTVSNGDTYVYFPFRMPMPEESDSRISQVTLQISNIDPELELAISAMTSPMAVTMQLVLASDPDEVEVALDFSMVSREWDAQTITAQLAFEDILNEAYPGDRVTPGTFPSAF